MADEYVLPASPKVTWAEVVATTVGTGAAPSPSAAEISQETLSDFIVELKKKDAVFLSELTRDLEEYKTTMIERFRSYSKVANRLYSEALDNRSEEAKEYRKQIIADKTIEFAERDEQLEEEMQLQTAKANLQRLAKLSPNLSLSDISRIASALEDLKQVQLLKYRKELEAERDGQLRSAAASSGLESNDVIMRKSKAVIVGLDRDMTFFQESTILLVEMSDNAFRASLAVTMASEPQFSKRELSKLIEFRDQERSKMVALSRTKKDQFAVAFDEFVETLQAYVENVKEICLHCFGFANGSYGHYFQTCFTPKTCLTDFGCS
jgi:hypothetical protein